MRSKMRQQVYEGVDITNSLGAIPPQSNDGTAITGAAIDRLGADTGFFLFEAAAASGTPSAAATAIKITHADTSGGTYSDFEVLETALDIKTAVAKQYMIDLSGAKRYLKIVVDSTYTAGTNPANVIAGKLILGDYNVDPKASQTVLS
jgi:hypothetical protein